MDYLNVYNILLIIASGVVDGGWSEYTVTSDCSASCGGGTQTLTRSCNSPSPANGGADCVGSDTSTQSCNTQACPIDGGWSTWVTGACSKSCGTGSQTKARQCNNPAPSNGGADCVGQETLTQSCNTQACSVDGGWSAWVSGACSVTCGAGTKESTRTCSNPAPSTSPKGAPCSGSAVINENCNEGECPSEAGKF